MPDQISVSEFIAETTEDYNSPTTSSFTTRLHNCRNTVTLLEEVGRGRCPPRTPPPRPRRPPAPGARPPAGDPGPPAGMPRCLPSRPPPRSWIVSISEPGRMGMLGPGEPHPLRDPLRPPRSQVIGGLGMCSPRPISPGAGGGERTERALDSPRQKKREVLSLSCALPGCQGGF